MLLPRYTRDRVATISRSLSETAADTMVSTTPQFRGTGYGHNRQICLCSHSVLQRYSNWRQVAATYTNHVVNHSSISAIIRTLALYCTGETSVYYFAILHTLEHSTIRLYWRDFSVLLRYTAHIGVLQHTL